ncbi:hypothetical protein VCHA37P193_30141 [Vibrio chagasii]|nr:hypothetical protein VCHA37P193_30141 [Vibrio chagasii]
MNRWVIKYAPLFEHQTRKIKKPVASSWRMDETYINVKGQVNYTRKSVLFISTKLCDTTYLGTIHLR